MTYRTLLLEDDSNSRHLLSLLLARRGHQVFGYDSPLRCPYLEKSICACYNDRPCFDFLISDNKMPGMTGLEFIVLQDQRGCRLDNRRKALLSGWLRDDEKRLAARLDCRVFEKPLNWIGFCQWLEEGEALISLVVE